MGPDQEGPVCGFGREGVWERVEVEFGGGLEEFGDDALGFVWGEGADGVGEGTSRLDSGGRGFQEVELDFGEAGDAFAIESPAGVGISPPGADGGARGIDEDAVEAF